MNKKLTIALTSALALGMAAPALADTTFKGWFATTASAGYLGADVDFDDDGEADWNSFQADGPVGRSLAHRGRFWMNNQINDFVKVVWAVEIDTLYGDKASGGALGADAKGIIENKNLYMAAMVPDTNFGMSLGTQGHSDSAMNGVYLSTDVTAAIFTYKMDMASLAFGRCDIEPTSAASAGDKLYVIQAGYDTDNLGLDLDVYVMDQKAGGAGTDNYYTIGLGANTTVADFGVGGFIGLQSGNDMGGMVGSIYGKGKVADIDASARLIYYSADDDQTDDDMTVFVDASGTYWGGEMLPIFLDSGAHYGDGGGYANKHAVDNGFGLIGIALNGKMAVSDYTVGAGLGYFMTAVDEIDTAMGTMELEGTDMGTEISLSVSRKLADVVTVTAGGSYALLGSFYDDTAIDEDGEIANPDNPYRMKVSVQTAF